MGAAFDNLNDMARMLLNGGFNVSASCDFKQLGMAVCVAKKALFATVTRSTSEPSFSCTARPVFEGSEEPYRACSEVLVKTIAPIAFMRARAIDGLRLR